MTTKDQSAVTVTEADREKRAEIVKFLMDAIDRPCLPGDGPDERNDELERIIARHRIQALEDAAKVADEYVSGDYDESSVTTAIHIAGDIREMKTGS